MRDGEIQRARVALIRPSKLLWIPVLIAAYLACELFGSPHLLWDFTYTGSYEDRYYLECRYIGRYTQRIAPENGECPYVRLLKSRGAN